MRHNDPYHAPNAPEEEPRNPEAIAAEAEYQLWNALVQSKDTASVIALHRAILAEQKGTSHE